MGDSLCGKHCFAAGAEGWMGGKRSFQGDTKHSGIERISFAICLSLGEVVWLLHCSDIKHKVTHFNTPYLKVFLEMLILESNTDFSLCFTQPGYDHFAPG